MSIEYIYIVKGAIEREREREREREYFLIGSEF